MSRLSLSVLAFLLVLRSAGATENALSHLLTPEEFSRAGLNKLTPAELDELAAVLARHQQLPIPPPASAGRSDAPASRAATHAPTAGGESVFGREQIEAVKSADTPAELRSRIVGRLEGYSGRAVFVLENGQIWQQRMPAEAYFRQPLTDPEVVITRGVGGYKMLIVPADQIVFVKRIQ